MARAAEHASTVQASAVRSELSEVARFVAESVLQTHGSLNRQELWDLRQLLRQKESLLLPTVTRKEFQEVTSLLRQELDGLHGKGVPFTASRLGKKDQLE